MDEVVIDAYGAQGGSWRAGENNGGLGAGATGTLVAVVPGDQIQMVVGGRGADAVEGSLTGGAGGFNGGGDRGDVETGRHGGGGGGGASTVRLNGTTLVIAGGGGGGLFGFPMGVGSGAGGGGRSSFGQPTTSFQAGARAGDGLVRLTYHLEGCGVAALQLVKSAPVEVEPGGQITWTLTVTNNGPDASPDTVVEDAVPAGVTGAASATPACAVTDQTLRCALGRLAVGASTQVRLTGTAPAASSTCITNSATARGALHDTDESNNHASATTCTDPRADVTIDKTVAAPTASVGDAVVYTLTVANRGPDAASDVQVGDTAPDRLQARRASTTAGTCTLTGNAVRCADGTLAVGQQGTITVGAVAVGTGTAINTATVTSPQCATNPCDDDTAEVRIGKPRLELPKA